MATLLVVGACRRTHSAAPVPTTTPPAAATANTRPAPVPDAAPVDRSAEAAERARVAARTTLEATIYFAYDRSDLDADARGLLDAKLPVLQANPSIRLRIAGHTDERGSDEYNLALGARRAAAAKRYLTQHGIDDARLDVVSFGEERPACTDVDETCFGRNRRAAFEIVVGTIADAGPTRR